MFEKPRVLVLGCGPAGLLAAHAAESLGFAVDIGSKKRRSEMFGAQYLHTNIPGLTDDQTPFKVEYRLSGSLDEYLHKVYGPKLPDKVTVESLVGMYDAWDIRRAYFAAWDIYAPRIIDTGDMGPSYVRGLLAANKWRVIISTIPASDICLNRREHFFSIRSIHAVGDAPERGVFAPVYVEEPNVILYDGTDEHAWYRASNIAGYNAVEWPAWRTPFDVSASIVGKPIRTNCNCWYSSPDALFMRVGRYGAWSREQHTHNAYWSTLDTLKDLL